MITMLKKFFSDETAFIGYIRGALLGLGALVMTGNIEMLAGYSKYGALLIALGGMIRAGEPNPKP